MFNDRFTIFQQSLAIVQQLLNNRFNNRLRMVQKSCNARSTIV